MPRSDWLRCGALALVLLAGAASAQEDAQPTLEGEPVTAPGQAQGSAAGAQDAAPEQPDTSELLPAFQGIETAIRGLVPEVDQEERQRQEQREIDDLSAQQDMARWAERVTWAAVGSLILTAVGVLLIWRTLYHTRRAADAAREAVDEAGQGTAAANRGADAAERQLASAEETAKRQLRAYVLAEKCWVENIQFHRPTYKLTLKNYGQTPAYKLKVWTAWRYYEGDQYDLPAGPPADLLLSDNLIGPEGFTIHWDEMELNQERKTKIYNETAICFVLGRATYKDIFDIDRTTTFRFAWGGHYKGLGPGNTLYVCEEGNDAT